MLHLVALVRTNILEVKNGVFWVVMPCSSCMVLTRATRRNNAEDTILHSHRRENLKSYILEVIRSSKMLVLTRAIWHNIPEDGILQSLQCLLVVEAAPIH
jgi:hypothetical protein